MDKKQAIQKLKDMAIAYKVSLHYDYCPNPDEYNDIKNYITFKKSILDEYQGLRPDEIANMMVSHILTEI